MGRAISIIINPGDVFGNFEVVEEIGRHSRGHRQILARCTVHDVERVHLINNLTKLKGCSCEPKPKAPARPKPKLPASMAAKPIDSLWVRESDGPSFVVADWRNPGVDEVVAWDLAENRWVCSCGALGPCDHSARVGTNLPYDVAVALGQQVRRARRVS